MSPDANPRCPVHGLGRSRIPSWYLLEEPVENWCLCEDGGYGDESLGEE